MNEDHLKKLSDYIVRMIEKGVDEERIKTELLSVGWSEEIVKNEMSKIRGIFEHDHKSSISDMSKIQGIFEHDHKSSISDMSKIKIPEQNTEPEIIENTKEGSITENIEPVIEQKEKAPEIEHTKPKIIKRAKNKMTKRVVQSIINKKKGGGKMPKKMTKEDAEYLLREVEPERCFWVNNGPIISSLEALQTAIKEVGEETFSYHVNNDKNDFSVWVNEVIGDKTLARNLSKAKTKGTFLKRVKNRITQLKKVAGR